MTSSRASDGSFTAENDALAKLNELSSRLWTMQGLREGLAEMLAATMALLGAHMGNVQILDAGRGVLTIAAQRGFEQDFLDFFREVSTEDDSACGRALRSGERIVIEDVETDAAYTPMRPVARAAGYRAVQSTPLIGRNGARLGMLSTYFETPHRPTELELRGLDLYARQAADFIERCQTDQALRDSEQRFRSFADTAPAMLWVTNADASANFLSRGWYDYTGQSEAEAMGQGGFGWLDAVHRDDLERAGRIFLEANQKHEPFSADYRLRRSDGEYRWAIDAGRPRFGPAGEFLGYIGSVVDVHERKQSEHALREADRRFRTMADAAPVLIWEADPRGAVFVNQHYLEFFGVDFDAVRAMGWAELLHPDDAAAYIEVYREAFERRLPYTHECRWRRADGQYRWLVTTGRPLGVNRFVGYCADITENKRTEELLRQKEERFRSLVSIIADVPWTTNAAGEFVEPQDAYARYTGKSWEELRGSGWINCIHPDDQPGLMDAWQRAVAAKTIYNATCREWHGPTRQWRHVIARGTPVLDADGSVREWVGTLIDVHDQRMAHQALRDSEARLQAERDDSELLRKVSVEMTNRGDAALLYERILDAAVTIMRSDYASVQMLYPDRGAGGELRLLGSRGFSPEATAFWEWVPADAASTCGLALKIGRRVVVPDVENCPEMAGSEDLATYLQTGIRAVQSTPLMSRSGVLVGMISTHWNTPHEPTERELRLFDILARQATHLIEQTNAVAALRESEERLRLLIEGAKDYAIFTLDLEGRITSWSEGARRMGGYTRDEVLGQPASRFYLPDDAGKPDAEMQRALETGRSEDESWRVRKDGSRVWVNEIMSPLSDATGRYVGFATISRDLTERKALEDALRHAHDSLEQRVRARTSQVQSLFQRLVSAQEEERRRIARDIHDQVGQQMSALRIHLEALRWQAEGGTATALVQQAELTQRLAEELDQSIDVLTWQLRPAALDDLGLSAALQDLVTGWAERFATAADFAVGVEDLRLSRDVEANLYRIVQEALHNIAKHARATQVTVYLTQQNGDLVLLVEDNGRGFDARMPPTDGHMGLLNMRERAALVGGRLDIESAAEHGTSIHVRIPQERRA